jgi:hypothetical protein
MGLYPPLVGHPAISEVLPMIHGPPEDKSMPGPRDGAPHGAKPDKPRRVRPPVRDVEPTEAERLKAKVRKRRENKPE